MAIKEGINIIIQEVKPDLEEKDGCLVGCISWLIGLGIICALLVLFFNFLMSHPVLLFIFVGLALFVGVKVSK
ncbi:preprotein translocase, SecE subunit domain protein [Enterococcus hirae]|uniref:preprotein translocase, SecE subunit domain protein n=1 Tax=Enterococcus hirae TaxID=1354 RepID=UPI001627557C|nr:preprotein translocase, SecE subunit domain protein [Enterococcus hirae]EMF0525548.1 preprotein translocase, SecE subunit domain protein [Enterococcus hirae]QNG05327.1 preprotein translocase, SecE subunit domain protein [Enterococcus hirae]